MSLSQISLVPESHLCFVVVFFRAQKVTNIDDVLEQHKLFLENCMKDCLLTNATLLGIIYKMMASCQTFSNFLLSTARSTALDYLHMNKSADADSASGGASSGLGDLVDYTKGTLISCVCFCVCLLKRAFDSVYLILFVTFCLYVCLHLCISDSSCF